MKIVIHTLGCKVNQYESDCLAFSLEKLGHEVSTKMEKADVYIINTCAVTNEAERKSRQMVGKLRELNPDAKILVCGCASEKETKQFKDLKNVTFVAGTYNKLALIDSLDKNGTYIDKQKRYYENNYVSIPNRTRAYIKIQDGCNNFCTYCIIPYLRGRSRSRDLLSILKEVDLLSGVVKEIVITGINITDYKIDGEPAIKTLVENLEPYKNKVRFRLGSLEQGIIDEEFAKALKNSNICPHFHMSLQSGSDSVLKRMNRHYTTSQFLASVKLLRKHYKNPCIATDVIVGFPGETDEEFNQTVKFIKKAKFYNLHIFPYSSRTGTVASRMKQLDGKIKKQRVKILENLNKKLNKKYIKKTKQQRHKVLIEEFVDGYFVGHLENYLKCYIKGEFKESDLFDVKIIKPYKDGCLCKKIKTKGE